MSRRPLIKARPPQPRKPTGRARPPGAARPPSESRRPGRAASPRPCPLMPVPAWRRKADTPPSRAVSALRPYPTGRRDAASGADETAVPSTDRNFGGGKATLAQWRKAGKVSPANDLRCANGRSALVSTQVGAAALASAPEGRRCIARGETPGREAASGSRKPRRGGGASPTAAPPGLQRRGGRSSFQGFHPWLCTTAPPGLSRSRSCRYQWAAAFGARPGANRPSEGNQAEARPRDAGKDSRHAGGGEYRDPGLPAGRPAAGVPVRGGVNGPIARRRRGGYLQSGVRLLREKEDQRGIWHI